MITIVDSQARGLIFDCDGTLVDTMPIHYQAWQETLRAAGGDFSEELFYELAGIPTEGIIRILNKNFGYQLDVQKTTEERDRRFLQNLSQIQPNEPVVNIARKYKDRLPMAVATGGLSMVVQPILKTIGLENFFDAVVTADDVANPKPAPDIFLEAARRLQVPPEYCQVFEDSDLGLEGAKKAGMIATDVRSWRTISEMAGESVENFSDQVNFFK